MDLRVWIEGTIVAAMATALSFIPIQTANSTFDLSLGLVPLVLYSYRRGLLPGLLSGLIWGILNILLGTAMKNFISVPQIIFEYPFAFTFGGMGGIFATKIQNALTAKKSNKAVLYVVLGGILAVFSRFFWHFWAGVFVWGIYAPKGMSPYWYSFVVNGVSALANMIYVGVVLGLLIKAAPQLFIPKKSQYMTDGMK